MNDDIEIAMPPISEGSALIPISLFNLKTDFPPNGYFDWLAQVKGGWAAFRAISQWHQWKDSLC